MKGIFSFSGICVAVVLLTLACSQNSTNDPFDPLADPKTDSREWLTVGQLQSPSLTELAHNDYFLPIGPAGEAEAFSGTLTFTANFMVTSCTPFTWEGGDYTLFPGFEMAFISHNGRLLPASQDLILTSTGTASGWNIAVAPGKVWRENTDQGRSRASFPFILTSAGVGQARNGLATFVYTGSVISNVFIQISQETAPAADYTHDNFTAQVKADYRPHPLEGTETLIAEFEKNRAGMLPVRPWSELPGAESLRALFNSGKSPDSVSAAAIVIDGILYRQACSTRSGPYPFPDEMRHGVYSVTKSLCAGLAMFWLAGRYGDGVFDERVTDHVPALRSHPGWKGVTFGHALNMVTGTMGSDEGEMILPFITARSAGQKIAAVSALPDDIHAPGEYFRYLSTNTFVLSYAVAEFVRKREGAAADYWQMIDREVLEPIGVHNMIVTRTFEPDGSGGIPILSWGSYPTLNETARIALLLLNEGNHDGQTLLSARHIREAVHPGYWQGYAGHYRHSFWWETTVIENCAIAAPYMSGRGGSSVVLMPNGLIAVLFSDDMNYNIIPLIRTLEILRSSCE